MLAPASTAVGATATAKPRILFPVVGPAEYGDDYGDPRANGSHEGNDILTDWRTPAVAVEAGTIKFWTQSRAGCMLYLHGRSGTTYLYIHLNNDLTRRRDNRGTCKPGVAYADGLEDGAHVEAGQEIAYNGDSGDAEGAYHLHFEVHPNDGEDVNPFPYLNRAERRLFPGVAGRPFAAGLRGTIVSAGSATLELRTTAVRWWPNGRWMSIEPRVVELSVSAGATIDSEVAAALHTQSARTLESSNTVLAVYTGATTATAAALRGDPSALAATRIVRSGGETIVWETAALDDDTATPPDRR